MAATGCMLVFKMMKSEPKLLLSLMDILGKASIYLLVWFLEMLYIGNKIGCDQSTNPKIVACLKEHSA